MYHARNILQWEYEEPFDLYNLSNNQEDFDELMNGTYYSVLNLEKNLVGFFCFGKSARVPGGIKLNLYSDESFLDIGLGLRPDLTAKGKGLRFIHTGLDFASENFATTKFRISVASFNKRAISVYKKAGFEMIETFTNTVNEMSNEFLLMYKE